MSNWVRGGTVAVTNGSTTIIGTGTDFTARRMVGWGVQIDGELTIHEIDSVVSATELTLVEPVQIATASGITYRIFPTQGLNIATLAEIELAKNELEAARIALEAATP